MSFSDIFKSKEERQREKKRVQRKAFRDAKKSVDAMKERVESLKEGRDTAWQEARNYLKNGQKKAAERSLQTVRSGELMIDKLEKKYWVSQQILVKLDLSKTDREFAQSLTSIQAVVDIDPDTVSDVFDEIKEKLGEQGEIEALWDSTYNDEMKGIAKEGAEIVPSLDEMMGELEEEVAMDIREDGVLEGDASLKKNISEEIGAGRQKLKELLGDEK